MSTVGQIKVTKHYQNLIDPTDKFDPLYLQVVYNTLEQEVLPEEKDDPLDDHHDEVVPGLIHRYPHKVLWLVTEKCASYCRFCFRKKIRQFPNCLENLENVYHYLHSNSQINELIFSGGDPFTLSTSDLEKIRARLADLSQLKIWRFHTRVPIFNPTQVDERLLTFFKQLIDADKQVVIVFHLNHPQEISVETKELVKKLLALGIEIKAQGVLLKNINDRPEILAQLWNSEMEIGIEPYYLHQLDRAPGTSHFLVEMEVGLKIYKKALTLLPNIPNQLKYIKDLGSAGKVEVERILK